MRGWLRGVFKLESDDFDRYKDKSIVVRGITLPFRPKMYKRRNNRTYQDRGDRGENESLTITIFDAYQRRYRHIENKVFDDHFNEIEGIEITKQTQPQTTKGTTTLNDNRFLKVKSTTGDKASIDVGSSIIIEGRKFNLMYDGMQKHCYLCGIKHGIVCPLKVRFEEMKKARKALVETKKRKMYGDSTFRHVNQLALSNNVACMSGGGIGQICNAIKLDTTHEEVIIHAGQNEIKNTDSLHEFVFTVQKTSEKLKEIAEISQVTVVLPSAPMFGAHEDGKAKYLKEKIKEIGNIKTIELEPVQYDFDDHPSEKGTM